MMQTKNQKKLLWAWASYDWANSAYALVISSAVFPLYYGALFKMAGTQQVQWAGITLKNTALISFVTALAFVCVALGSPLLSGIADYMGNKKRFMQFFCYLGALSCVGLGFFDLSNLYWGMGCFFLGLIGFWGSLVFYNAYLPDLASPDQQDLWSARGYALGYVGSVLLLVVNLAMVLQPDWFGITDTAHEPAALKAMRYSFISVGVWWMVCSQWAFVVLPMTPTGKTFSADIFWKGFRELKWVWQQMHHLPALKKYLSSFFVYSMAVQTVMLMATYFGEQEIAWRDADQRTQGLISSILIIQLVAVLGAIATSKASSRWGNRNTLIGLNVVWLGLCVTAYSVYTPMQFYAVAMCVGLVMGGIQSLSRSTYAKLLPDTPDTTSFFSFYDVAEKVGIVIGMFLYGLIDQWTGSMRLSIVFLALFFALGGALLLRMPSQQSH